MSKPSEELLSEISAGIERAMALTSSIEESIKTLSELATHPEIDRIITHIQNQHSENRQLWAMIKALEKAVQGRKIQADY